MPSGAETTDALSSMEARVGRIGVFFAERGILGFVWLDEDLIVTDRYGALAGFFTVGQPAAECFPALTGLENDLRAHRQTPQAYLELPGISIATRPDIVPSLNVITYWDAGIGRHTLLLSRMASRTDLEIELSRQVRARLMAEEEVMEQSRELARLNTELARANRDLEDYAGIISHDLASPLRALRHLTELISEGLGAGATPEIAGRLEELKRQSLRMSGMLSSLLDYASAGRRDDTAQPVDTRALVADIVASIPRPQGFSINIEGAWPTIVTFAAPLDLVLRNLVDNAIKHHDRAQGTLTVAAVETSSSLDISVADDGPGIAEADRKVIFLPYRTLERVPVSGPQSVHRGMGLAIVARTLDAVGGAITVECGEHGERGTRFTVRWPLRALP